MKEAVGHHGYLVPSQVGPTGAPQGVSVSGATAMVGMDTMSQPPPIELEHGSHDQSTDTFRLLTHGGWFALNPAIGSVHAAKPAADGGFSRSLA